MVIIMQVHLYSVLPGSDVWHSGIVAYGREYFFTGRGVVSVMPVRTMNNLSGMFGNELSSDPAKLHRYLFRLSLIINLRILGPNKNCPEFRVGRRL